MTVTVHIPANFARDHSDRELPTGVLIRTTSKLYTYVCDQAEAEEWLSDADFYSDAVRMMGPDFLGLQSSARATVKRVRAALEEQGRGQGPVEVPARHLHRQRVLA